MTNIHVNVQTGEITETAYTVEEAATIKAIQDKRESERPMREWKASMQGTDNGMPRYLEDHIKDDHDGIASNEFLQVKYDAKIKLRGERP